MGVGVSTFGLARTVAHRRSNRRGFRHRASTRLWFATCNSVIRARTTDGPWRPSRSRRWSERILARFFRSWTARPSDAPFKLKPMPSLKTRTPARGVDRRREFRRGVLWRARVTMVMSASITSRKIQLPHSCPRCMARCSQGSDGFSWAAGIPRAIPGDPRSLEPSHESVELRIDVHVGRTRRRASSSTASIPSFSRDGALRPDATPAVCSDRRRGAAGRNAGAPNHRGPSTDSSSRTGAPVAHNAPPRVDGIRTPPMGNPFIPTGTSPTWRPLRAIGLPFWVAGSQADRREPLVAAQ